MPDQLLFDCDLTMGLPGRDVDDGLALLTLLGSPNIELLGITSTFGNSNIDDVHDCLETTCTELNLSALPLHRGGTAPGDRDSPAARFIADALQRALRPLRILATGSVTNLSAALELAPTAFANVQEVIFMGGITEPLLLDGREMKELNFSCDPEAIYKVLYAGRPVTVITGNICLQALLTESAFDQFLQRLSAEAAAFLEPKIRPWFAIIRKNYGLPGFHVWDAVAALYLSHPDLFDHPSVAVISSTEDLSRGYLKTELDPHSPVTLPTRILDSERFWALLFDSWEKALSEIF